MGAKNFKIISNLERAFYLRLHALQATVSSYARVLFMSLSAHLVAFQHIYIDLAVNYSHSSF
ncbi:hypothetical protein D3856_10395 [Streptococcus mutans]|nr:hypothetical protein [Streptococcus mutans]